MKKFARLLLGTAIAVILIPGTLAASKGSLANFQPSKAYVAGQFSDVPSGAWYEKSVKSAYEYGLVKGSSKSTFNPSGSITIAETLALADRLNSIYFNNGADFTQGQPWYQVYVDYAVENGIIGVSAFDNYTAKATRAEFAQILANALPDSAYTAINTVEDGTIPDVSGSGAYVDAIYKLYRAGIVAGSDSRGTFKPNSDIQRSEVAAIVTRIADESTRKSITLTYCSVYGHSWKNGSCTEKSVCSVCGAKKDASGHEWKAATCTNPKTCSICGATEGEALGHSYSNGYCTRCGDEKTYTVSLPKTPLTVSYISSGSGDVRSSAKNTYLNAYQGATKNGKACICISIKGEKTYDKDGEFGDTPVCFKVVAYNSSGKVVDSSNVYAFDLVVGESFSETIFLEKTSYYEDYTIKIVND